jgi:hypothetical protein
MPRGHPLRYAAACTTLPGCSDTSHHRPFRLTAAVTSTTSTHHQHLHVCYPQPQQHSSRLNTYPAMLSCHHRHHRHRCQQRLLPGAPIRHVVKGHRAQTCAPSAASHTRHVHTYDSSWHGVSALPLSVLSAIQPACRHSAAFLFFLSYHLYHHATCCAVICCTPSSLAYHRLSSVHKQWSPSVSIMSSPFVSLISLSH